MNKDKKQYRNDKRENSRAGSIFMDFRNELDSFNQNIVVYGHRMREGSSSCKIG